MTSNDCPYGFRVVGSAHAPRREIAFAAAFRAYCAADPDASPDAEAYLSAFRFGEDFRTYFALHNSTAGFDGPCWSDWLWVDIDHAGNLGEALQSARRLVGGALERYPALDEDDPLVFFSGSKGFHVGVPLPAAVPPSGHFHATCRRLAEALSEEAGAGIDTGIYDRVRLFRAPNSRHPKTGLHKRRLMHEELFGVSMDRILGLAREPLPFDAPRAVHADPRLMQDWQAAEAAVVHSLTTARTLARPQDRSLQRATLDFIRDGADDGERNMRLFRAAANLRELQAPDHLIHALLTDAARDSGLPPKEINATIRSAITTFDSKPTTENN